MRIIDPSEMVQQEIQNRFDIKMYSNLSIPSFSHAYSIGVEYAKNWFLSKFSSGYFKKENIFINEKFVFDDYRKLSKQDRLKRGSPFLTITPEINTDFDLENVYMYNYGVDTFAKMASWSSDSFFRDPERGLYLVMNMKLMEMRVNFRVQVYTRAQQYDLMEKLKLHFRIGATSGEDKNMDFHIPMDIMVNIAHDAGFEVTDKATIKNPIEFTKYLNAHSDFPIMYKMRGATGNHEYFMRIPQLYIHANCMDKLNVDDGTMRGQLRTHYNIDMSVTFRMPAPSFYVYYTKEPLVYTFDKFEQEKGRYRFDILTQKMVSIPLTNEQGWNKMVWTQYVTDDGEQFIDMTSLFGDSEFAKVMNYTKDLNVSPSYYLDLKVFTSDPTEDDTLKIHMDWEHNLIIFDTPMTSKCIYISIYVDTVYYNSVVAKFDDANNNRIN